MDAIGGRTQGRDAARILAIKSYNEQALMDVTPKYS